MGQQPGESPTGGWPPPSGPPAGAANWPPPPSGPPSGPPAGAANWPRPPSAGGPSSWPPSPSAPTAWPTPTASGPIGPVWPDQHAAPDPAPVPREALDYPVLYNPAPAVERWFQRKRTRNSRIVSVVLSIGISGLLWWFYREDLGDLFWWIAGISLGLALLQFGWAAVQAVRAKRAIDRLHEGLALGIGRGGLYAHDTYLPWAELAGLSTKPGRFGDSPSLLIRPAGGAAPLRLPLDFLGRRPAAIDGAVRALSGGRAWVDLSDLDA